MRKLRVAINGFGRIGRGVLRAFIDYDGFSYFGSPLNLKATDGENHHCKSGRRLEQSSGCTNSTSLDVFSAASQYFRYCDLFEIVAINSGDLTPEYAAFALNYDSVYGRCSKRIGLSDRGILIGSSEVAVLPYREVSDIPWDDYQIDLILECTGAFKTREKILRHREKVSNARIIVSSPFAEADGTIVLGANTCALSDKSIILSVGSCTTNCFAPLAKVMNDLFDIEMVFVNTVHAYTNDQNLVDARHTDFRRSRSAPLSMIPTSTGMTKAIGVVLPELAGKVHGAAVRVPVANVSMIDAVCQVKQDLPPVKEIIALISDYIENRRTEKLSFVSNDIASLCLIGDLTKIIGINSEPLVSIDFGNTTESAIFDSTQLMRLNKNFVRFCAWYDNEWAFSHRMLDICVGLSLMEVG